MAPDHCADAAARAVDGTRLWRLLMDVARIGGLASGGVAREALTDLDTEAKRFVIAWARRRGLAVFQDEAASLFVRLEGVNANADPVLIGSHLDTQPTGGKYDGAYGVLAGLEVLEALKSLGVPPARPVEVVAWTNEEGSRFLPGATGSSAFAGTRLLSEMADAETADGRRVGDEIARSIAGTDAPQRPMGALRPHAYLEAHIEQGPILDARGLSVGIVSGIQGIRRLKLVFRGRTAHAGTTPHDMRADALVAAARCIVAAEVLTAADPVLRLTFGRIEVEPNATNTVPAVARLTIDLRHPSDLELDRIFGELSSLAEKSRGHCDFTLDQISAVAPVDFDPGVVALLDRAASRLGIAHCALSSGAGHDALHLARVCPSGMVFIPCRDGVSHHEDESIENEDAIAGARVLAHAAAILAAAS